MFPKLVVVVVAVASGLTSTLTGVEGFCWEPGRNPSFTTTPRVEQISLSRVRVSWKGIVSKRDCVDEFLVKYWQRNAPVRYKLTELVGPEVNYIDIDVVPKVPYIFQAVAREDKGPVRGVDWNKSLQASFQTSSYKTEIDDPPPEPDVEYATKGDENSTVAPTRGDPRPSDGGIRGLSIEVLAFIVFGLLIICLIVVGLMYNCLRKKKSSDSGNPERDLDDDDSDGFPDERTAFRTPKVDDEIDI